MVSTQKEAVKLIDDFLDSIWLERGLSQNTLSSYRQDLINFSRWLGSKKLVKVDKPDILDYLAFRLQKNTVVVLQLVLYLV